MRTPGEGGSSCGITCTCCSRQTERIPSAVILHAPVIRRQRPDVTTQALRAHLGCGSEWSPNDGAPDNPIRRGMDRNAYRPRQTPGGYLRGCAKTEVALRDDLPRPAEFAAADRPHAKGPVLPILRRSTLSAAKAEGHPKCGDAYTYGLAGREPGRKRDCNAANLSYSHEGHEFSDYAAELRRHPQVDRGSRIFLGTGHIKRFRRSSVVRGQDRDESRLTPRRALDICAPDRRSAWTTGA
jgi:hypothetical protein